MTSPRLLSGHAIPHYAGSRPGLFSALLKSCTHPTKAGSLDSVAAKLLDQFKEVPLVMLAQLGEAGTKSRTSGQGSKITLNLAGARSVVLMAVKLGLLNESFFWTWRGHTINIICEKEESQNSSFLELELAERIAYLKYYLEADGAMLLTLGEQILENPAGITTQDLFEKPFVDVAFRKIYLSYLELTGNLGARTILRQKLSKLEGQAYDSYTRRHKILPRLLPLEDFGLLARDITKNGETFLPLKQDTKIPLQILVTNLGSIEKMEQRFTDGEYFKIIANSLLNNINNLLLDDHKSTVYQEIAYTYVRLQNTGIAVYPLHTIEDVVCIRLLANHAILARQDQVVESLQLLQKDQPHDIRFHVDRQGRPAYIVISDNLLQEIAGNQAR